MLFNISWGTDLFREYFITGSSGCWVSVVSPMTNNKFDVFTVVTRIGK